MATIHYSVSGEGRGHAARAQVLLHLLKERHNVVIHAYGAALEMLRPLHEKKLAEVREIPGMRFAYDRNGTLNRPASLIQALPFLAKLPVRAARMARVLEKEKVDLCIADFEPLLPRAANLARVPVMSVDHQQFLTCYDLSRLPSHLRRKASFLAPFVEPYYEKLTRAVISAFFFPPVKKRRVPITQAGVLLRPEILDATPTRGSHLVAYMRREAPHRVLSALSGCGLSVHVYGHGAREPNGSLSFRAVDAQAFAEDLASSAGLVTTAGNQVVGEALYLKKPVLAYPEPGNFEQHINAFFLGQSGQGLSYPVEEFSSALIREFVDAIPALADRIRPERLNGNRVTLSAIEGEVAAATLTRGQRLKRALVAASRLSTRQL